MNLFSAIIKNGSVAFDSFHLDWIKHLDKHIYEIFFINIYIFKHFYNTKYMVRTCV